MWRCGKKLGMEPEDADIFVAATSPYLSQEKSTYRLLDLQPYIPSFILIAYLGMWLYMPACTAEVSNFHWWLRINEVRIVSDNDCTPTNHIRVSINMGIPKCMVYNGKSSEDAWFRGTPILGTSIWIPSINDNQRQLDTPQDWFNTWQTLVKGLLVRKDFEDQNLHRALKSTVSVWVSRIRHDHRSVPIHRKSLRSRFSAGFPPKAPPSTSTWLSVGEERHQAQDQRRSESSGQRRKQQKGAAAVVA